MAQCKNPFNPHLHSGKKKKILRVNAKIISYPISRTTFRAWVESENKPVSNEHWNWGRSGASVKASPLPSSKTWILWLLPFFSPYILSIDLCEEPLPSSPAAAACGWSLLISHWQQLIINLEMTFHSWAVFTKVITNVHLFFFNLIAPVEMTLWKIL